MFGAYVLPVSKVLLIRQIHLLIALAGAVSSGLMGRRMIA